ncbi:MAG TPA: hypothetical protein VD701_07405 [Steroidobacteraceae bacterium]|nr:hypothetical protein [Steroidobacteraceae bacterium]
MVVVFLHGPAASGKHTIGKLLADRTGLPLFHNHLTVDLVTALFPFGSPGFVTLRARLWLAAFEEAAHAGRSFIFTFHPEATVDPQLIRELQAVVDATGGKVLYVELACPRDVVLQRLGHESRAAFGKLTDRKRYEQIERDGGFEFPPLPAPLLRVETDRTTPAEAADAIAAALRAARAI